MADDVPTTAPTKRSAGRDLPAAIGVGVGLIALVVVTLAFFHWGFILLVAAMLSLGAWELFRALERLKARAAIWPIILGYYETTRIICAWCETRKDFRSFRSDRVVSASVLDERFPERPSSLRVKWRKAMEADWKRRKAEMEKHKAAGAGC